jgi:hypothetical protein
MSGNENEAESDDYEMAFNKGMALWDIVTRVVKPEYDIARLRKHWKDYPPIVPTFEDLKLMDIQKFGKMQFGNKKALDETNAGAVRQEAATYQKHLDLMEADDDNADDDDADEEEDHERVPERTPASISKSSFSKSASKTKRKRKSSSSRRRSHHKSRNNSGSSESSSDSSSSGTLSSKSDFDSDSSDSDYSNYRRRRRRKEKKKRKKEKLLGSLVELVASRIVNDIDGGVQSSQIKELRKKTNKN